MTLTDRYNRIECLDQLIRQSRTGSAQKIAQRLGVCERTIHDEIDRMRAFGAEIKWCPRRQSYYYVRPGRFRFGWFPADDKNQV